MTIGDVIDGSIKQGTLTQEGVDLKVAVMRDYEVYAHEWADIDGAKNCCVMWTSRTVFAEAVHLLEGEPLTGTVVVHLLDTKRMRLVDDAELSKIAFWDKF